MMTSIRIPTVLYIFLQGVDYVKYCSNQREEIALLAQDWMQFTLSIRN